VGYVHFGMEIGHILKVEVPQTFRTVTEATAAGIEAARDAAKRLIERDRAAE